MCQHHGVAPDAKRSIIHAAAIAQFAEQGYRATSMADIASAAGMSRPALYQYFANKGDIFASAFVALFEEHVASALLALFHPGSTAEQLDGFLQRYEGDLWEKMATSSHIDEISSAKTADVGAAIAGEVMRLRDGMATYLRQVAPGRSAAVKTARLGWLEMLQLSPKGFRFDQPTVATYRRRLTSLAQSVAADIEASPR